MAAENVWARTLAVAGVVAVFVTALTGSAVAATPGPLAGYSAPPSGATTQTVTTSVLVPTVACASVPSGGFQSVVAGVRIEEPSGLTTGNTGGSVLLACNGPTPSYQPHIQIDGVAISSGLVINPGDLITATASVGPSAATVTLTDGAQSQTASGAGSSVIAEDVGMIAVNCAFAGSPCQPVPQTTPTSFSGSTIGGMDLLAAGAAHRKLTDAAGQVEMISRNLHAHATAFTGKWRHSCGVGPGGC